MKLRTSVILAACAMALAALPAWAQFKPTKTVEFIVHTGPGGGADVLARFIAQTIEKDKLAPVSFKVTNKSGGGGLTAMAYVAEKKGDTHAIAVFTGNWLTNPLVRKEAKFTVRDLTPVVRLVLEPACPRPPCIRPFKRPERSSS